MQVNSFRNEIIYEHYILYNNMIGKRCTCLYIYMKHNACTFVDDILEFLFSSQHILSGKLSFIYLHFQSWWFPWSAAVLHFLYPLNFFPFAICAIVWKWENSWDKAISLSPPPFYFDIWFKRNLVDATRSNKEILKKKLVV